MWTSPLYHLQPLNPNTQRMLGKSIIVSNFVDTRNGYFVNVVPINISQQILRISRKDNSGRR